MARCASGCKTEPAALKNLCAEVYFPHQGLERLGIRKGPPLFGDTHAEIVDVLSEVVFLKLIAR